MELVNVKHGMHLKRLDGQGNVRCVKHVRSINDELYVCFGRNALGFQKADQFKEVTQHGTELKGNKRVNSEFSG